MTLRKVQEGAVSYLIIMLENFQNLFRIFENSLRNGVPEGSRALGRPFREAGRPRERFFMDLGVFWESILGPIWEVVVLKIVRKSIEGATKSFKVLNALLDGFPH